MRSLVIAVPAESRVGVEALAAAARDVDAGVAEAVAAEPRMTRRERRERVPAARRHRAASVLWMEPFPGRVRASLPSRVRLAARRRAAGAGAATRRDDLGALRAPRLQHAALLVAHHHVLVRELELQVQEHVPELARVRLQERARTQRAPVLASPLEAGPVQRRRRRGARRRRGRLDHPVFVLARGRRRQRALPLLDQRVHVYVVEEVVVERRRQVVEAARRGRRRTRRDAPRRRRRRRRFVFLDGAHGSAFRAVAATGIREHPRARGVRARAVLVGGALGPRGRRRALERRTRRLRVPGSAATVVGPAEGGRARVRRADVRDGAPEELEARERARVHRARGREDGRHVRGTTRRVAVGVDEGRALVGHRGDEDLTARAHGKYARDSPVRTRGPTCVSLCLSRRTPRVHRPSHASCRGNWKAAPGRRGCQDGRTTHGRGTQLVQT
jgi:hypothetical protein